MSLSVTDRPLNPSQQSSSETLPTSRSDCGRFSCITHLLQNIAGRITTLYNQVKNWILAFCNQDRVPSRAESPSTSRPESRSATPTPAPRARHETAPTQITLTEAELNIPLTDEQNQELHQALCTPHASRLRGHHEGNPLRCIVNNVPYLLSHEYDYSTQQFHVNIGQGTYLLDRIIFEINYSTNPVTYFKPNPGPYIPNVINPRIVPITDPEELRLCKQIMKQAHALVWPILEPTFEFPLTAMEQAERARQLQTSAEVSSAI